MGERACRVLLIGSFTILSWLAFMVVHESGHILFAQLSGASMSRVNLHPLQISWSTFDPNPHPQIVAWCGPVIGAVIPLLLFASARFLRVPGSYLFQFFAGFGLVANGIYLLIDAFVREGDARTLLLNGAMLWQILAFAALATPIGFWLWHGLGGHFGLGAGRGRVSHRATFFSLILLGVVVLAELILYRASD